MIDGLGKAEEVNKKWVKIVTDNFNEFIQDQADCERQSSAMALSLVAKYPDKEKAVPALIQLGVQKLNRFQQVYSFMVEKGISLPPELPNNLYVKQLSWLVKNSREERYLDKMLIGGIIEAREQQRLTLLYKHVKDPATKKLFDNLFKMDHVNTYYELACQYFPTKVIDTRLKELMKEEENIINKLDIRPALH